MTAEPVMVSPGSASATVKLTTFEAAPWLTVWLLIGPPKTGLLFCTYSTKDSRLLLPLSAAMITTSMPPLKLLDTAKLTLFGGLPENVGPVMVGSAGGTGALTKRNGSLK